MPHHEKYRVTITNFNGILQTKTSVYYKFKHPLTTNDNSAV